MSLPLPDDATVTLTMGQLRSLVEGRTSSFFDGIGTAEAAEITGESPRTLRRLWSTWDRVQADGGRPRIRVSRKSESERSDLLFDRSDCYAYRDRSGTERASGPAGKSGDEAPSVADPDDPNDIEAITDRLLSKE